MKKLFIFSLIAFLSLGCTALPANDSIGQKSSVGPKKQIVFIHGMFVTPKSWDKWLNYFSDKYQVSAPAWPLHDQAVPELQQHLAAALGQLTLKNVLDHYRAILAPMKNDPPILVGHSMGGLIAQILLSEGYGSAAVVIDSAPPKGVFVVSGSFLKSNWPSISPFANVDEPIQLSFDDFSYAFTNQQNIEEQEDAYRNFYVPESRRVGKGPLSEDAKIDCSHSRGPLLIIAGGSDHIIPAKLNYANFEFYKDAPAANNYTEFQLFEGRDHWTIAGPGWENVAATVKNWIKSLE